ncbi:MAG: beta-galactosidase [Gemmatimonadetes bacterium]|jgi:beta-galactosidase|nr:beta-galactosidase [Gemmatimonadota bacterium]MBT7861594.1 beta-galactosidase [Gemmatimonadota bacterium]
MAATPNQPKSVAGDNTRPHSHLRVSNFETFMWGATYYPEQGDFATLDLDAQRMRAAGMNTVRMAEFAWDLMEPEEDRFDFSLFDEVIERLGAQGIRTILCTPTAAPPRWLTVKHPEILRVDDQGVVQVHGSRQHASTCSDVFRDYSRRITRTMAGHFRDNPHVIGWQTDNEFNCHFSEDYSVGAKAGWVTFLDEKFSGDIDALNRSWGTVFWAQTYTRFSDVPLPVRAAPTHLNPAHHLDYFRFISWSVARFQHDQVEILRATQPNWWITHNGIFDLIDYRGRFGQDLDVLGYDAYPMFTLDHRQRAADQARKLDEARAWTGNFIIPEFQSGPGGQTNYLHDNPEPGELRSMYYTALAHGADGILLFRWRSVRFGAEEYWCGVLDHDNVPRRRYEEVAQFGAELSRVGPALLGTHVAIDVAVAATDFDNTNGHTALHFGLPSPDQVAAEVHGHFWRAGYQVGVVHPSDVLDGLKLYIVPHLALLDPAWVPRLEAWVRAGGVLVIGARTGTKDLDNNVVTDLLPGALRPLVGATVIEYGRQNTPELRPLKLEIGDQPVLSSDWYELLEPDKSTEVWARWTTRHQTGSAAVTLHHVGEGAVLYVGTYLNGEVGEALVPELAQIAGLTPALANTPAGVEVVRRESADCGLWFVINHNEEPSTVTVPAGQDLVTDRDVAGPLELPARGVAVILTTPAS